MSHTGIRLRLEIPGAGPILDGDSDWLHMTALLATGAPVPDFADTRPPEPVWHQIANINGQLLIWVQPVMLPDSYPDDEGRADED